jgi:hypothetical protein
MINNVKAFILFIVFFCSIEAGGKEDHLVTYRFNGGRFGDNLMIYLSALYFSHQNGIPLLYKSFPYSQYLKLSSYGYHGEITQKQMKVVDESLLGASFSLAKMKRSTLFIVPINFWQHVKFVDAKFKNLAKKLVSPNVQLKLVKPPKDSISVAIHWRQGGGFDKDGWELVFPLKCPNREFYIEAFATVLNQFPDEKIYCHIFTDAQLPDILAEELRSIFPDKEKITFNVRQGENRHDKNVLEDFFSMMNFDILIRPNSNLSRVAAKIHDFLMVCYPAEYRIENKKVVITKIAYESVGIGF